MSVLNYCLSDWRAAVNQAKSMDSDQDLCNGGGGGSRTPVRKALRPEAYMLSSIRLGSPAAVRMSKKRSRLVR